MAVVVAVAKDDDTAGAGVADETPSVDTHGCWPRTAPEQRSS
jgi:hypothetical protein